MVSRLHFGLFFLASALLIVAAGEEDKAGGDSSDLSNGWNDKIAWTTWSKALEKAKEEKKPILLLIHRTWCGACKSLKPKFAASKQIEELSSELLMVNSHDEKEFTEETFSPDGGYIPRVLFFDYEGNHLKDIVQRTDKYKYFHHDYPSIVEGMKKALKAVADLAGSETSGTQEEKKEEL